MDSDEPEANPHLLRDLLADLNLRNHAGQAASAPLPTAAAAAAAANSSPSPLPDPPNAASNPSVSYSATPPTAHRPASSPSAHTAPSSRHVSSSHTPSPVPTTTTRGSPDLPPRPPPWVASRNAPACPVPSRSSSHALTATSHRLRAREPSNDGTLQFAPNIDRYSPVSVPRDAPPPYVPPVITKPAPMITSAAPPATASASLESMGDLSSVCNAPATSGMPNGTGPSPRFSTPVRSIFASGPPTASLSVKTAQASMSSPPSASVTTPHPLSALAAPSSLTIRRTPPAYSQASASVDAEGEPEMSRSVRTTRFAGVEKAADDPSSASDDPSHSRRRESQTPTTLSSLFTAPETPPSNSRPHSYIRTPSGVQYARVNPADVTPLPNHLYANGLLGGRHSDITVHAFGQSYRLHRLLLDRAPFFCSAFSGPWSESSASDITLHPEEIDASITRTAFELALKRLYGCFSPAEEESEAMGLFATGCWLDMADLIEASIHALLRQMTPGKLSAYIRFVTSSYYGRHGDRILAASKAMMCREGFELPEDCFDGVPGDIVREIVGSDGFFVPSEWERWKLAKNLLNYRLRARAFEAGLLSPDGTLVAPCPRSLGLMAVRFDGVYRHTAPVSSNSGAAATDVDTWLALYTHPDVAPLLVLLDEGVHYMHLSFEQLQSIRSRRDALGVPLVPERVISNALWMAMELRQKVLNSSDLDLELGLTEETTAIEDQSVSEDQENTRPNTGGLSEKAAGKQSVADSYITQADQDDKSGMMSDSWDGNGKPRKFWIPQADATYILGGGLEPVLTAPNGSPLATRDKRTSPRSAGLEPRDMAWATDFASATQERPESMPSRPFAAATGGAEVASPGERPANAAYSHFPPFRFAVEFPPMRALKDTKRFYSRTVWYAGSCWNIYLQKKETTKHTQLGVYLHRERHLMMSGGAAEAAGGIAAAAQVAPEETMPGLLHHSVDDRIGQLERDLLRRNNGPTSRRHSGRTSLGGTNRYATHLGGSLAESADTTLVSSESASAGGALHRTSESGAASLAKMSTMSSVATLPTTRGEINASDSDDEEAYDHEDEADAEFDSHASVSTSTHPRQRAARRLRRRVHVATLPPYVDGRARIQTYFKIFTPSRAGRVLSAYESTPDTFPFGQSFGWRSKDLVLDDGYGNQDPTPGSGSADGSAGKRSSSGSERASSISQAGGVDGRLRFMVVLGNV